MNGDGPKDRVRVDLLARRRAMSSAERSGAGEALAAHAAAEAVLARPSRVAAYLSMTSEPSTSALLDGWWSRGTTVIVPVVEADHRLSWVELGPDSPLTSGALGIPEPAGTRLGPEALATCALVVAPALAVDHAGHRLGRGAGYYDRALAEVDAPICAVVFTHELLPDVPHEPHDVRVQMALTPGGLFRVP